LPESDATLSSDEEDETVADEALGQAALATVAVTRDETLGQAALAKVAQEDVARGSAA
jgi:hypothetical protein